jgi:hypothetical protein
MAVAWVMACSLIACGPGHDWVGEWRGNRNLPVPEGSTPEMAHMVGDVRLILRNDGTFTLTEAGMPKHGFYSTSGDRAMLKVRRILDKPIEMLGSGAEQMNLPIEVTWVGHDTLRINDPGAFIKAPITLQRYRAP